MVSSGNQPSPLPPSLPAPPRLPARAGPYEEMSSSSKAPYCDSGCPVPNLILDTITVYHKFVATKDRRQGPLTPLSDLEQACKGPFCPLCLIGASWEGALCPLV